MTSSNRVYSWGSHPHGLRHFVHSHRKARGGGKQTFEHAESHLRPQLVDTSYVHGRIKQVNAMDHFAILWFSFDKIRSTGVML